MMNLPPSIILIAPLTMIRKSEIMTRTPELNIQFVCKISKVCKISRFIVFLFPNILYA